MSPSSQRVWIEIAKTRSNRWFCPRHPLHRGCGLKLVLNLIRVTKNRHPLHRGCGLKFGGLKGSTDKTESPSSQRVWIEIKWINSNLTDFSSHPLHRGCGLKYDDVALFTEGVDWNRLLLLQLLIFLVSPSSQRVWIEIKTEHFLKGVYNCHPLHRGCGLKYIRTSQSWYKFWCHPLHRGCGLK